MHQPYPCTSNSSSLTSALAIRERSKIVLKQKLYILKPAEISIFCPVILLVCKRFTIVAAQSDTSAKRFKAFVCTVAANCSSENDFDQSVLRTPGDTQLTTMWGLHATASEAVRCMAPAFDTANDRKRAHISLNGNREIYGAAIGGALDS